MIKWAKYYAGMGWPVFPIHGVMENGKCSCGSPRCKPKQAGKHPITRNGFHEATTDINQIDAWWTAKPWANIGIATGSLFVVDIDIKNNIDGFASLNSLCNGNGPLPETVTTQTGSGGQHLIFTLPSGVVLGNRTAMAPGVDTRGTGGYIIAPPSKNAFGSYSFLKTSQLSELPQWFCDLVDAPKKAFANALNQKDKDKTPKIWMKDQLAIPEVIPFGQRDILITRFVGQWCALGMDHDTAISRAASILLPLCETSEDDPFDLDDIKKIVDSIFKKDNASRGKFYRYTDQGNLERLKDHYGDYLRFAKQGEGSGWYVWTGKNWRPNSIPYVSQYVLNIIKNMHLEAIELRNNDQKESAKLLSAWAHMSESRPKQQAITGLAESQFPFVSVEGLDLFDQKSDLLNMDNCTLDLKNLTQKPHEKTDFLTKILPYDYDPNAQCPRWMQFLQEVFCQTDLMEYMQCLAGYCLTGETTEQSFWIFYGTGANGKSTFLEILNEVLGSYTVTTPFSTFHLSDNNSVPNDLAAMKGSRLVSSNEGKKGRALNENLLKSLSGGDTVSARFLYREWFSYVPTFKIILSSNHQHPVFGQDYGLWRRLKYITFTKQFDKSTADPQLKAKLQAELPGILNWAIEGLRKWREHGLITPGSVQASIDAFKADLDTTGAFLEDCVTFDKNAFSPNKDVEKAFASWYKAEFCGADLSDKMPHHWQTNLQEDLRSKGMKSGRRINKSGKNKRGWFGFSVKFNPSTINFAEQLEVDRLKKQAISAKSL